MRTASVKRTAAGRSPRSNEHPAHHVDVIWILLWVLLIIWFLATAGIVFAIVDPAGLSLVR